MWRLSRENAMKNYRTVILSLLFVTLMVSSFPVAAFAGSSGAGTKFSEAFLVDCSGRFLRISTVTSQVLAQGTLWDHPSMADFRLPAGGYDGCLVAGIQFEPRRDILYAAVAQEKRLDFEGRRHYRIVALRLPDLRRIGSREIQETVEGGPHLLLVPGHNELLASYSRFEEIAGEGAWRNVMEHFSAPALAPVSINEDLRRMTDDDRLPSSVALSRSAEWAGGGRILDQTWILDDSGRTLERLDPYSLLTPVFKDDLKSLERLGDKGQPYLGIAFADSSSQRTLFAIGHETGPGSASKGAALWVYDISSASSLRPILTKEAVAAYDPMRREMPTVHLSPDGNSILLERFEWRQGDRGTGPQLFKTGLVDLYDIGTRSLIRTVTLKPAPGSSSRLLGISPDGSLALFGTAERLYVAPLEGSRSPKVVGTGRSFDAFWTVGVVFR